MPLDTQHRPVEPLIADIMAGRAERTFTVFSKAWYAKSNPRETDFVDEIMVGLSARNEGGGDDGTHGEFGFRWSNLGKGTACRLEMYDETWRILPIFQDLFEALPGLATANDNRKMVDHNGWKTTPSVEMIAEKLVELGYTDTTNRNSPYE